VSCCELYIVRCKKSDFWGACINKSIRHFLGGMHQYFMLCNNDTYHFKTSSYRLAKALRDHPVVISNSINVPFSLAEDLYDNCVIEADQGLIGKFRVESPVAFDRNLCKFISGNVASANVAPTVALAISREFLTKVGSKGLVPRLIPHYLSDYYFTHQLYKHGAVLSPLVEWPVFRFENDYRPIEKWSLFNPKVHLYIPAWITFLLLNSSVIGILKLIVQSVAFKVWKTRAK
jgi:hypothetical protein